MALGSKLEKAYLTLVKPPTPASKAPNLSAVTAGGGEGEVTFTFNPTEFTITKQASWKRKDQASAQSAAMPEYKGPKPASMSLEVFLDASESDTPDVAKKAQQLLDAVTPIKQTLSDNKPSAPWVVFGWGRFMSFVGVVTKVDAKYTLFDPDGTPVRAVCTLSLEEVPTDPPPRQNPTSGGVTARRSHQVVAGDSLPSIAAEAFGAPDRWRDIADANGIDDPMSLQPGTELLIPDPDEAGELAAVD